jgi:hypothetical protein
LGLATKLLRCIGQRQERRSVGNANLNAVEQVILNRIIRPAQGVSEGQTVC